MNEVNRYQPFSEIPSAILWDILIRVPIKTCLTCKLVCKTWYHVVKSPEFSSLHRRFNASEFALLLYNGSGGGRGTTTFNLVELKKALDADDSRGCTVGVDDLIRVQPKVATPLGICETWYLRSHCNGVVCLETVTSEYVVCYLLTRHCVSVRNLHELKKPSYIIKHCELGCCPVTSQFKVLMFLYDTVYDILVAKIQTLGDGEWRVVGNVPFQDPNDGCFLGNGEWRFVGNVPFKGPSHGCFLNGSSHWCGPTCIWSFHFGKEEFSQIPLPDDAIRAPLMSMKEFFVFDSCLCLRYFSGSQDVNCSVEKYVWMMKEYGVRNSWVRQLVIGTDAFRVPLAQMDTGKMLLKRGKKLYLHDPRTQVSKGVRFKLSNSMVPFAACDARFFRF